MAPPAPVSITVQPGFTLWSIAQERFGEGVMYVQVFEANKDKIHNPNNPHLIHPGQVFEIPSLSGEVREGTYDPDRDYPTFGQ